MINASRLAHQSRDGVGQGAGTEAPPPLYSVKSRSNHSGHASTLTSCGVTPSATTSQLTCGDHRCRAVIRSLIMSRSAGKRECRRRRRRAYNHPQIKSKCVITVACTLRYINIDCILNDTCREYRHASWKCLC